MSKKNNTDTSPAPYELAQALFDRCSNACVNERAVKLSIHAMTAFADRWTVQAPDVTGFDDLAEADLNIIFDMLVEVYGRELVREMAQAYAEAA